MSHANHVVFNENSAGNYNALSAAATVGIKRVCLASSINAIGGVFSRQPRYDYFPLDEQHPTVATGIVEAEFVNLAGAGGEVPEAIEVGVEHDAASGLPAVDEAEGRARDRLGARHLSGSRHHHCGDAAGRGDRGGQRFGGT